MSDINLSKIRRLDGTLMLIFRELMRQRRSTTVAERLGLTQSAVSHALARLRDLFEDPLFIRRPNSLEPTQRALEIAPRIEELIRIADAALGTGKLFNPATTQRNFRIAGGEFMSALIAAPLLRCFKREAPNASFVFRFALGTQALDHLQRDEVDIAVGRFTSRTEGFHREHLYDDEYCVVARVGHPRVQGSIDLQTFTEVDHIIVSLTGHLEQLGDDNLKQQHVERHIVAAVPRFLTGLTLVAQSDAILMVQRRLAVRYANTFGLQVLVPPHETKSFSHFAMSRLQDREDPAIDWLIKKFRESVEID